MNKSFDESDNSCTEHRRTERTWTQASVVASRCIGNSNCLYRVRSSTYLFGVSQTEHIYAFSFVWNVTCLKFVFSMMSSTSSIPGNSRTEFIDRPQYWQSLSFELRSTLSNPNSVLDVELPTNIFHQNCMFWIECCFTTSHSANRIKRTKLFVQSKCC